MNQRLADFQQAVADLQEAVANSIQIVYGRIGVAELPAQPTERRHGDPIRDMAFGPAVMPRVEQRKRKRVKKG